MRVWYQDVSGIRVWGFRVQEFRVVGVLGCRRIGLRIFEVYWAVN